MYDIKPLAYTAVNWQVLHEMCQSTLGFSPTRGLDATGFDAETCSAYLACLDFENQPLANLREGHYNNNTFTHVSFSFITAIPTSLIVEIRLLTNLKTFAKQRKDLWLTIITGDMSEWRESIIKGCSQMRDFELRILFNQCLIFFNNAGFKEIWHDYDRIELQDKSFWLRRSR